MFLHVSLCVLLKRSCIVAISWWRYSALKHRSRYVYLKMSKSWSTNLIVENGDSISIQDKLQSWAYTFIIYIVIGVLH